MRLVQSLSRLQEEQKYTEEVLLERVGVALVRGSVIEIAGEASTGKTSLALSLFSKLTGTGEICAIVDGAGSFDPCTAFLGAVELENVLWIRCGGDIEKAFMSADHLVQAKGFGAIWLNLNGIAQDKLRMVPKTYWYRYRNRIKETPTLFLVTAREHVTGSASQQTFQLSRERARWSGWGKFKLLREIEIKANSQRGFYGEAFRSGIEMDYTEI
ncbi:MAG: hypothetical protein WKF34_02560 [Pyrinomonadaceae bacterium]